MTKEKIVKYIFLLFLFFFLVLLFAEANGYYESNTTKAKNLTEEQIKNFEKDIASGKNIDISDYTVTRTNYSTKLSNTIYKKSLSLEKSVDKVIKYLFKKAADAVNE